jgi:hypothetical protein
MFSTVCWRLLGRNWDKSLESFPPCDSQSPLLTDFTPPTPLSKSGFKLVCNVNIDYGKSETSSLRTLKIMPRETSTKLYVIEFGFWSNRCPS